MSQYKSVRRTKPGLTTQATSRSQSVVSVLLCTTAFTGRWMVLSTPSTADVGHHQSSLPAIPLAVSLVDINTHGLQKTTNPEKMRARGCRTPQ